MAFIALFLNKMIFLKHHPNAMPLWALFLHLHFRTDCDAAELKTCWVFKMALNYKNNKIP